MERPVSLNEIQVALRENDSHRSPGPDGFNFGWLKHMWNSISEKVLHFFDEFHKTGVIPKGSRLSLFSF